MTSSAAQLRSDHRELRNSQLSKVRQTPRLALALDGAGDLLLLVNLQSVHCSVLCCLTRAIKCNISTSSVCRSDQSKLRDKNRFLIDRLICWLAKKEGSSQENDGACRGWVERFQKQDDNYWINKAKIFHNVNLEFISRTLVAQQNFVVIINK